MRSIVDMDRPPRPTSGPRYVYGIVRSIDSPNQPGPGLFGMPVRFLTREGLTAIISAVEGPVPGRREDLLAHHQVLEELAQRATVLPLRFGTVFDSEEELILELLVRRRPAIEKLFRELEGTAEVTVKAIFEEEAVMREILAEQPAIRRLSERTRSLPEDATYFARVRLGELVAGALEVKRERTAYEILASLSPAAMNVSRSDPPTEYTALSASFLVARDHLDAFCREVGKVESSFGGTLRFRVTGPLPPYSFTSLELDSTRGRER
jgi:Gas vesicle synthesis protein GvpL/GvpF